MRPLTPAADRRGQCVEFCLHGTLELPDGFGPLRNTPRVNPDASPCQLCLKCPPACPTGALDASIKDMYLVDMGQAYILKDKCHNHTDGIMCMTCYDRYFPEASFLLLPRPVWAVACASMSAPSMLWWSCLPR